MDSGLFGQYDALALAPGVFAVWALARGRWVVAGVAVGLGLLGKPQGLLMLPIAAFAVCVAPSASLAAIARRAATVGIAALLTVAVGSAPWTLADGAAWIARCYRMNLFEVLPYTTLEAFNVWYLIGLVTERQPVFDVLSSTAVVAGLSRDAWGRVFLATALVTSAAFAWRWRRRPARALVLFALLWLWSVFIWPTRVHERYVLYALPSAIAAAAVWPRLRAVAAVLLVVATMELGWTVWRTGPSLGTFDKRAVEQLHQERFQVYWKDKPPTMENAMAGPKPEESKSLAFARQRADRARTLPLEWVLVVLSLGAYAAAVGLVARSAVDDDTTTADAPRIDVLASA
jgi:hypothetical protein